jgi:hypothetical protein
VTTITINQAIELTFTAAEDACNASRKCKQFGARGCKAAGIGVQCAALEFNKSSRGKKTKCSQKILWTADTGQLVGTEQGKRKCTRGW